MSPSCRESGPSAQPGEQLQVVAVGRSEVETASAFIRVEFSRQLVPRVRGEANAARLYAFQDGVELFIADVECVVVRLEALLLIEVEMRLSHPYNGESAGRTSGRLLRHFQAKDISEERRSFLLVLCGNNQMI